MNRKFGIAALLGLLILNFIFLLLVINHHELNLDEATDFWVAQGQWSLQSSVDRGTLADVWVANRNSLSGPLFPTLLHLWSFFNQSTFFLRLLSVIFSMGAVGIFFLVLKNQKVPLIRNLIYCNLLAWNGALLWDASNLRAYALLNLILMGSLYLFQRDHHLASKRLMYMSWEQTGLLVLISWLGYGGLIYLPAILLTYGFMQLRKSLKLKDIFTFVMRHYLKWLVILVSGFLLWLSTVRFQPTSYPASYVSMLSDYHGIMLLLQMVVLIPKMLFWMVLGSWNGLEQLFGLLGLDLVWIFGMGASAFGGLLYFLYRNQGVFKKYDFLWVLLGILILFALVASILGKFPLGFSRHNHFLIPVGFLLFVLLAEYALTKKSPPKMKFRKVWIWTLLMFFLGGNHLLAVGDAVNYLKSDCFKKRTQEIQFKSTDYLFTNSQVLAATAKHYWRYELGLPLKHFSYDPRQIVTGNHAGWVLINYHRDECGFKIKPR